jgi:hypothetical protein
MLPTDLDLSKKFKLQEVKSKIPKPKPTGSKAAIPPKDPSKKVPNMNMQVQAKQLLQSFSQSNIFTR